MAAARAEEARPAVAALRLVEHMALAEVLRKLRVRDALVDVAELVALAADELMARIEVAVLRDGNVLMAGTTARQALGDARAVREVHVEVEEPEAPALAVALHVGLGQAVVLLADARQVFLREAERAVLHDDRLDREDVEALVDHREDVLREVHIIVGVGAAQVRVDAAVVPVAALAACDALLEVLDDAVVRAVAARIRAHGVVDFLAAVEREHEREVVVVEPLDVLIIEEHAVRRHRELELLARLLLALAGVLRHSLDGLHVHERLAAEEVDLAVLARAAALDEEVDGALADFRRHDSALLAVAAAVAEAVLAAQVAVLRNHETDGLDEALLLERRRHIDVRREELTHLHEFVELPERFAEVRFRIDVLERRDDCLVVRAVERVHHVVDHLVDDMDRTAVDVEQDVMAALFEFMDFRFHRYSFDSKKAFPDGKALHETLFLANLIAYRAGSLASRLAGCLALAAAARLERSLHRRFVDRLDVFHRQPS